MTDTHWAAISTGMILAPVWAFVALVANAVLTYSSVAVITGLFVALVLLPGTWRFCEREARLAKGEQHADRKD